MAPLIPNTQIIVAKAGGPTSSLFDCPFRSMPFQGRHLCGSQAQNLCIGRIKRSVASGYAGTRGIERQLGDYPMAMQKQNSAEGLSSNGVQMTPGEDGRSYRHDRQNANAQ